MPAEALTTAAAFANGTDDVGRVRELVPSDQLAEEQPSSLTLGSRREEARS